MNRKNGFMGILMVLGAIVMLLLVGVLFVFGSSTLNFVMDEVVPEFQGLGVVGSANLSEAVELTIVPANAFIQQVTWLSGVLYFIGILGVLGLAFAYRATAEKWMIPLFVALAIILIVISLIISVTYEEFYGGTDEIASVLREHTLISYMIIYSPLIFAFIIFVAGIILFSGGVEQ